MYVINLDLMVNKDFLTADSVHIKGKGEGWHAQEP